MALEGPCPFTMALLGNRVVLISRTSTNQTVMLMKSAAPYCNNFWFPRIVLVSVHSREMI